MKNYYMGVNYWDSTSGTDMWVNFDEAVIDADLAALEAIGVDTLRIFPNWRDFQPVMNVYGWGGNFMEHRLKGERFPEDTFFLDPVMIERFLTFCDLAQKHGMKLVVGVVTGWMSGRLFVPPALEGKNIITDPEALMWQTRFCHGFVRAVKHHPAIDAWELGNECNCLGHTPTRYAAYVWTSTIRSAISLEDPDRPVYSGMHGLASETGMQWMVQDQGELTDMLTCHPYPSPTVGGDVTPANRLRCTMIPTAQLAYYSGISGRPAMIEEQGTFSDMLINREGAADFMRVNLLSGWANGSRGYLWWCGMEHLKLSHPPYSWSMIERELGILDIDRNPKPVGRTMKEISAVLSTMPELPEKQIDGVCVLPRDTKHWPSAAPAYILAKQAGIELTMRTADQIHRTADLPDAPLYIVPTLTGWAPLHKEAYDALLEKANNGATVYFSVATGFITECEKVTGMRSNGMYNAGGDTMTFTDGSSLPMCYQKKFLLESVGAEVLARDSYGNPVFTKNSFGKGTVYMLYFPMEQMMWNNALAFTGKEKPDYSRIYRIIGEDVLKNHPIDSANNQVGMTLHPTDTGYYAVLVNYDNMTHDAEVSVADGWTMEPVYGDVTSIGKCNMAVVKLSRAE
ncbi:MAG: hypothetical protein E7632_03955 [Ruminococcaceae bacterium]|nr:hypothetical protein [Oscillospiraceae bacterium]